MATQESTRATRFAVTGGLLALTLAGCVLWAPIQLSGQASQQPAPQEQAGGSVPPQVETLDTTGMTCLGLSTTAFQVKAYLGTWKGEDRDYGYFMLPKGDEAHWLILYDTEFGKTLRVDVDSKAELSLTDGALVLINKVGSAPQPKEFSPSSTTNTGPSIQTCVPMSQLRSWSTTGGCWGAEYYDFNSQQWVTPCNQAKDACLLTLVYTQAAGGTTEYHSADCGSGGKVLRNASTLCWTY